jgi:hypothetical protein
MLCLFRNTMIQKLWSKKIIYSFIHLFIKQSVSKYPKNKMHNLARSLPLLLQIESQIGLSKPTPSQL